MQVCRYSISGSKRAEFMSKNISSVSFCRSLLFKRERKLYNKVKCALHNTACKNISVWHINLRADNYHSSLTRVYFRHLFCLFKILFILQIILYFPIVYYTILHSTILYYTVLYYTILYCTVSHYTITQLER